MADEFDRASELEQLATDLAIKKTLQNAERTPKLEPTGYCQNPACWDEFEEGSGRLYCNADCEKEHRRIIFLQGG